MNADEFNILKDKIDSIQASVDRIDRDLGRDRQDIAQLTIRTGAMEGQVDEMRKAVSTQANKIRDKVEDIVQPLVEGIEKKKTLFLREPSFWKRLWKGW